MSFDKLDKNTIGIIASYLDTCSKYYMSRSCSHLKKKIIITEFEYNIAMLEIINRKINDLKRYKNIMRINISNLYEKNKDTIKICKKCYSNNYGSPLVTCGVCNDHMCKNHIYTKLIFEKDDKRYKSPTGEYGVPVNICSKTCYGFIYDYY